MAGIREKLEVMFGVSGADKFKKEFEEADRTVQKSSRGITTSLKGIATAAAAYLSFQTARAVGRAVFELSKMADQFRVVQSSSQRLAKSIGQNSNEILAAVRRGVGGAVSDLEILKQVNQAILLGIPITANAMGNMAVVATRLGRAVGRDAASALGDLVTGIGRMSPLILDNLGITIKAEEAFRGLGEGATDAEKRIAFFNAVMNKANERSDQLGNIAPSLTERWDKVNASFKNWATTITTDVLPAIEALAIGIDKLIPKPTGGTVIDNAIANPTINALRAKSAGLRARGRSTDADFIDAQIRAMQNTAVQNTTNTLPGEVSRRNDSNKTRAAAILMALQEEDLSPNGGFRAMSDAAQSRILKTGDHFALRNTGEFGGDVVDGFVLGLTKSLDTKSADWGKTFKKVADEGGEAMEAIPARFEETFNRSLANVQISLQALGLQGGSRLFGGLSTVTSGVSGFNQASQMKVAGDGFLDRIQPGLLKFTSAMSVFSGAVSTFGAASGLIAALAREDFQKKSDEEIIRLSEDPIAYNALGQRIEGQEAIDNARSTLTGGQADREAASVRNQARAEAQARGLNVSGSGSNAYSVATSISETQANSMLAVLETQRAQQAEHINISSRQLAVQTDIKFLMSINSGNLMTFAG